MAVNGKRKGSTGERELALLLGGWAKQVGISVALTRNLEQTRAGGHDLNGLPGLSIECKRVERMALGSWWAQTVRQAEAINATPFLAWRCNRKPWAFRTRSLLYMFDPVANQARHVEIDVDLDEKGGKRWFQHWVYYNLRDSP